MKVVCYLATLPRKLEYTSDQSLQAATDKLNTLKFFIQGVQACGDEGVVVDDANYQPSDVAVILGWVHEHGKTAPHLQLRQQILDGQRAYNGRTVIADSNLFLYKNTSNPGYWLRYSFDGIFPNTGQYCDTAPEPARWSAVQQNLNIHLKPWRTQGNHVLLCLQRDGGWSMGGVEVLDWAMKIILQLRRYTNRTIRIRAHPGDKRAKKYCDRLMKLCVGRRLLNVELSTPDTSLEHDLKNCWAVVNHNSSPAVGAAIEGIPVFVTDPERSQVREIAETRLDKIETPITPDRDAWIQRISQFHWSHQELQDGTAWAHMRKFVEK
jgi:hypothetical protein